MQTTYSFLDSVLVFAHPLALEPIVITGKGIGQATVRMREDRTAMDVAADGAVMVSKMAGNTGTISIVVQQTSEAHKALLKLFNILVPADTTNWSVGVLTFRNVTDGTGHLCTGVAFVKVGDKDYQREGQRVTWELMAADIQSVTVG